MTTEAQNELMTRVGPGTSGNALLRSYWQPVLLSEELSETRPLKAVRLFGQNFVVFRDDQGRLGMLDRDCPHRGADLAFGRLENGGLRCAFHGWLFDVEGRCLETPAEPVGSALCQRVRQHSYPIVERSGIVFGYLGQSVPPAFPAFDCFEAPNEYTFAFKGFIDCNWLQALEVGIDPAHASYLHRFFEDEDVNASYGKQFRGESANSQMRITRVLREFGRPEIRVESTDYGMRLIALRRLSDGQTHVRVTNLVFPQAFVIPMSPEMTISQWHVPIDDYQCYWYAIFTSFGAAVKKDEMRNQRLQLYELPDYKPRRNKTNQYGFDADEQQRLTYTGMGSDINVHDQWAIESQGAIQDRTREHLGTSDKGIIAYRRMLLAALKQDAKAPMLPDEASARSLTGPIAVDVVAPVEDWEQYWRDCDQERRDRCPWRTHASAVEEQVSVVR
jgi:phthalate 4,5-dioxygenase